MLAQALPSYLIGSKGILIFQKDLWVEKQVTFLPSTVFADVL